MDELSPDKPAESTAIATAGQYSAEIKKAPALPPLSRENMAWAVEISKELVRDDYHLDDIVTFGNDAQADVTRITKDMLSGVRVGALDEVIRLAEGVLAEVRILKVADLVPGPRRGFMGIPEAAAAIKRRIKDFFRRYELVNSRLDRQEAQILVREAASSDRFHKDKALARATLEALLEAQVKTTAIKLFLEGERGYAEARRRLQAMNAEKQAAEAEGRSMDYLKVASADQYGKYLERLETKAVALQKLVLSAYQMNVTIRMMGDNENIIRQKLSDLRNELLPQWRTMIAVAYQAYQQYGISRFVAELSRAETEIRTATGKQIERAAEGVAALMTHPVIDVEAMRIYNQRLVSALDRLRTASIESGNIRAAAEVEMKKLIRDLDQGVAGTIRTADGYSRAGNKHG